MNIEKSYDLNPSTEIQFLKGVGPRRSEIFQKRNVNNAADLLEYFPRDYEFRPSLILTKDLTVDHQVSVAGIIDQMQYNRRSRPPRMDVVLEDPSGRCRLVWFHGQYMRDKLFPGDKIIAWGKVTRYKHSLQIVNPAWKKIQDADELLDEENQVITIYPAGGDLSSNEIARIIRRSLDQMLPGVRERYDQDYRRQRNLPARRQAYEWIHRPQNTDQIKNARRSMAYDELLLMELAIALKKERLQRTQPACPLALTKKIDQHIRRLFPFLFTDDQNKVITEICADAARSQPMNRLLQGDVGSGKTAVALYAALLAVANRKQVAVMAPTEILAEQHFLSFRKYLKHSQVNIALLKGGLTGNKRRELIQQITTGEIDVVIGTQALLQTDVAFKELALVIIDEQHKFGVRQRQTIRSKDVAPHYLVMTATPIPRTLAMTVFGELEVSTITKLPPGRKPVKTSWINPEKLPEAYNSIRKLIDQGQQAYFVYPRVEEADDREPSDESPTDFPPADDLKAAVAEHKKLQTEIFPNFDVGLLHGQMNQQSKQKVMDDFRTGKLDILVATVVIEVGVDVPNATVMVIEHAERFGLAQLHQLRGRIGRGNKQSYCLLFGQAKTDDAGKRLEIMTKTNDGFRIAEEDLSIRGPGQFFGTSQHGLPDLKVADLIKDFQLLCMARRDAFQIAKDDPYLQKESNQTLKRDLLNIFGDSLKFIDVG